MAANDFKDFITHIKRIGLPTGSHYEVIIDGRAANSQVVSMLANTCSIPGVNILTSELRMFGETQETGYGVSYDPVTMGFLLDNNATVKKFFDEWTDLIFDRKTRTSGYPDDYASNVIIRLKDKMGKEVYTVTLMGAYPKSVQEIPLSYESHEVLTLQVTMYYKYWITGEANGSVSKEDVGKKTPDTKNIDRLEVPTLDVGGKISLVDKNTIFDFGGNLGQKLSKYGGEMSSSLGITTNNAATAAATSTIPSASGFANSFKSLTSNVSSLGSGISDLGRSLNDITAPVTAMAGAVSSVSSTLGGIDSLLNSIGLGTPFSKIRTDMNGTAAKLGSVAALKGLPGSINSVGVNMAAMGNQFNQLSKSFEKIPGSTAKLQSALEKLGVNSNMHGQNISNAAVNIKKEAEGT